MKKILGIIIVGAIIGAAAGYYFIAYRPKMVENKKLTSSENITDVIEMKSGSSIMGKILKEIPDSILIRNAAGTMEISVPRKQIVTVRKATADDLEAARIELENAEKAAKEAARYDKEREARLKAYYEERNKSEISSAQRLKTQGQSNLSEAIKTAKSKGQVIRGMSQSDVIEVYGQPDSKKSEFQGNASRERWFYTKCARIKTGTIDFYDGKVE